MSGRRLDVLGLRRTIYGVCALVVLAVLAVMVVVLLHAR